jgi:hypothetical protein
MLIYLSVELCISADFDVFNSYTVLTYEYHLISFICTCRLFDLMKACHGDFERCC